MRKMLMLAVMLLMSVSASYAQTSAPRCSGSIGQWTATETATGGSQDVLFGVRAEGGCYIDSSGRARVGGRADGYAVPGTTAPSFDHPDTLKAVEAWFLVSYKVAGPISVALFGGLQHSVENNGGVIGIGGAAQSACGGLRADFHGGYNVAGYCNRYSPAQTLQDGKRLDGPAVVGTLVLPVSKPDKAPRIALAANFAYLLKTDGRRHDYLLAVGPTIGVGK